MGIITILWEKWVEFRRDFYKITPGGNDRTANVSDRIRNGNPDHFSWTAIPEFSDSGCGITDNYERKLQRHCAEPKRTETVWEGFDQVMISPTPLWQFIAGQIIGGSLRGLYAGGIILLLTAPIETGLIFNGWSFLVMFLNGAVFSAIGVVVSFLAKNHADVPRFSNYIIMPMAYLCNTFFSTEKPSGIYRQVCISLAIIPDQPSDEKHFIRWGGELHWYWDSASLSAGVYCSSIMVYL